VEKAGAIRLLSTVTNQEGNLVMSYVAAPDIFGAAYLIVPFIVIIINIFFRNRSKLPPGTSHLNINHGRKI
jgi:hypothetical protein